MDVDMPIAFASLRSHRRFAKFPQFTGTIEEVSQGTQGLTYGIQASKEHLLPDLAP